MPKTNFDNDYVYELEGSVTKATTFMNLLRLMIGSIFYCSPKTNYN